MANMRTYDSPTGLKKIVKISDSITMLVYTTREALCKALCRIEEHYESPEFKGKIFTLGQYREWYSSRYGAWTYYKDWSGFNIPGASLDLFNRGLFDPLEPEESEVIDLFRHKTGTFCIIGTFEGGDADVFEHEICHAMFCTNPEYKSEVLEALSEFDNGLGALKKMLIDDLGYNESVLLDECHAYVCESSDWLKEKGIDFPEELVQILKEIKAKHRD